jgi:hypothetical protein
MHFTIKGQGRLEAPPAGLAAFGRLRALLKRNAILRRWPRIEGCCTALNDK